MRKRYKIWLIIIVILLILVGCVGISAMFWSREEPKKVKNSSNVVSNIEDFGYTLDDRDTEYMKEEFDNLKEILAQEEIDYEAYASSLAKLFVIDFYTLKNKINKYDVGSLEYIYQDKVTEFNNKAMDTIYNDIIDNTYKDRVQDLPEITEVTIEDLTIGDFLLKEETIECYKITMKYTYKKDLGYDKEGTIYLTRNDKKLEVVYYTPKIEEKEEA